MTALELFAILVLAGAIVVLLYYYIQEMKRTGSAGFDTVKSSVTTMGKGVSEAGSRVSEGISQQYSSRNVEGESRMSGVGERVSEMSKKTWGRVKDVPISTDVLSSRIDEFLNEQSDQLIKDWSLATKSDVNELEKRYSKVSRDVDELAKRFDEFRGHANRKFEHIEKRLKVLEDEEEPEMSQ